MLRARHFFCEKVGRCEGCRARKPVPYFRLKTVRLAPCGGRDPTFSQKKCGPRKIPFGKHESCVSQVLPIANQRRGNMMRTCSFVLTFNRAVVVRVVR